MSKGRKHSAGQRLANACVVHEGPLDKQGLTMTLYKYSQWNQQLRIIQTLDLQMASGGCSFEERLVLRGVA